MMGGVKWSLPEAIKDKDAPSVTLEQMEELVTVARMAGAPDNASLQVDVVMALMSPINVHRVLFDWER